jgi:hypothetical protein
MGLLARWRTWRLERRVRKGKQTYGRQGQMVAEMPSEATMSARVYRVATDTWEDLGVVGKSKVDRKTHERLVREARKKEK